MIIEERVTRLETHVEHIRSDMVEVKDNIKRVEAKVDAVKDCVAGLENRMLGLFGELEKKMLTGFAEIKVGRVWDRVWMLMIAAGLLGVLARGFKWI